MRWGWGGMGGGVRRRGRAQVCKLAITLFKKMVPASAQEKLQDSFPAENLGGGTPPPPLTAPSSPPKPADGGIGVCLCSCEVNYFVL